MTRSASSSVAAVTLCFLAALPLVSCGSQQPSQAQAYAMCEQLAKAVSTPTMKLEVTMSGLGGTGMADGKVMCSASDDPGHSQDANFETVYGRDIGNGGVVTQTQGLPLPTPAPISIPDE